MNAFETAWESLEPKARKRFLLCFLPIGILFFAGMLFVFIRDGELHNAVRLGDLDTIERLLDRHPDWIERPNRLGMTPLLDAAYGGKAEVLELLIRRGANLNAQWRASGPPGNLCNALYTVAINGNVRSAEVLLLAGMDVNSKTLLSGETPLDLAIRNNHGALIEFFKKHGGKTGEQ